jgi:hypothetical protein
MGKMSEIGVTLKEYEENLHAYGHADPLVVELKRELMTYGMTEVKTLVECIDHEFDTIVFNNQTEGRF